MREIILHWPQQLKYLTWILNDTHCYTIWEKVMIFLYMCIFSYIDGYFAYSGSDVAPLNISIINNGKFHSLTANSIILVSRFP